MIFITLLCLYFWSFNDKKIKKKVFSFIEELKFFRIVLFSTLICKCVTVILLKWVTKYYFSGAHNCILIKCPTASNNSWFCPEKSHPKYRKYKTMFSGYLLNLKLSLRFPKGPLENCKNSFFLLIEKRSD